MRRRVKPHRDAAPRTFGTFRREVVALLVAKGMSGEEATRAALRWNDYVKARWEAGKPPCAVSDHLMRWQKEKVVCPCKRNGDPSPRCKVHGRRRRRVGRDAANPQPGEVYEAKTSGRRWEVVSVKDERITMKPVGARSEGEVVFAKSSLKGMKVLQGAVSSLLDNLLGKSKPEEDDSIQREVSAARRAAIEKQLGPVDLKGKPANRDPNRRRRLARKAASRRRRRTR